MGVVPFIPPEIVASGDASRIRSSAPVIGNGQWREMADLTNWLSGQGAQLICGSPRMRVVSEEGFGTPFDTLSPGGAGVVHVAYVWPRTTHTRRVWLVTLGTFDPGTAFGEFRDLSGSTTLGTYTVTSQVSDTVPLQLFRIVEEWTPATGLTGLYMTSDSDSDTPVQIHNVCCFELPIASLSTIPNEQTLNTKEPIYEEASNAASLDLVCRTANALPTHARRAGLFSWYTFTPITITATTFTGTSNVFRVPPTVIPRHLYGTTTTATVNWALYGQASGGNAEVRVTWSSGHVTTVTIATTSLTAITGASTVRDEDISRLDDDGGIRTGSRDFATIEIRCTTATSYAVNGFYMGEG